MFRRFVDVTRMITNSTEVWPGDPVIRIEKVGNQDPLAPLVSSVSFGTHTGTHMDFPLHMHIDLPAPSLDRLIGECAVYEGLCLHRLLSDGKPVSERVLIKKAALAANDAELLIEMGVKLVGVEQQSIDEGSSLLVHRLLLSAGVAVIEGLLLDGVEEGPAFLIALPLSMEAADGAPVRAVLAY